MTLTIASNEPAKQSRGPLAALSAGRRQTPATGRHRVQGAAERPDVRHRIGRSGLHARRNSTCNRKDRSNKSPAVSEPPGFTTIRLSSLQLRTAQNLHGHRLLGTRSSNHLHRLDAEHWTGVCRRTRSSRRRRPTRRAASRRGASRRRSAGRRTAPGPGTRSSARTLDRAGDLDLVVHMRRNRLFIAAQVITRGRRATCADRAGAAAGT
jgi:hypothetical protein